MSRARSIAGACATCAVAIAFVACGDGSALSPDDAGPDAAAPDASRSDVGPPGFAVAEPASPMPPALPELVPCPDGWREIDASIDGARACDPWPEAGRDDNCGPGEAHFPGESACAPIGTPCSPDDEWAIDLPVDRRIVYVRPGATGGDGSRARPYGTIERGLQGARGSIVALAKGTYELTEPQTVDGRVVWGACAAETFVVAARESWEMTAFVFAGDGAGVHGMTIRGPGLGVVALGGSELVIESTIMESPGFTGVWARGDQATVELAVRSVVIRDARALADAEGTEATALFANLGARVTVERALIDGCVTWCVIAASEASIELRRVAIGGVAAAPGDRVAVGISSSHGAVVDVRESIVSVRPPSEPTDARAAAEAIDHAFLDVDASVLEAGGFGVIATDGSRAHLARTRVTGHADDAIAGADVSTIVELEDVIVENGLRDLPLNAGGVNVSDGATATLSRVAIRESEGFGILGARESEEDAAPMIAAEDVVIEDVSGVRPEDGTYGVGIGVSRGTALIARRVAVRDTTFVGVSIEIASSAEIDDLEVTDVRPGESATTREIAGFGVSVQGGSSLVLRHASITRASSVGLVALEGGTTVHAEDVEVSDTTGLPISGRYGVGLLVLDDGAATAGPLRVTLDRARIADARDVAVFVQGREDTDVSFRASELEVIDTRAAACNPACDEPASGTGVLAISHVRVEVERFRFARSPYAALIFDPTAEVALVRGEITENLIGLLYDGIDALDPTRVVSQVTFADNVEDVVSRDVVIPDAPGSPVE